jgi:hypothetical protein
VLSGWSRHCQKPSRSCSFALGASRTSGTPGRGLRLGQPRFHLGRHVRVQLSQAVQAMAVAELRVGALFEVGLKSQIKLERNLTTIDGSRHFSRGWNLRWACGVNIGLGSLSGSRAALSWSAELRAKSAGWSPGQWWCHSPYARYGKRLEEPPVGKRAGEGERADRRSRRKKPLGLEMLSTNP